MTAAHDREPEWPPMWYRDWVERTGGGEGEGADLVEPRSTMSRVDVPVSDGTLVVWRVFADLCRTEGPDLALRYLDQIDKPSAHHRPRLNELLRCAREGRLQ